MKRISVGLNKATIVDDRGVTFTATKHGNCWFFEGVMYENPFKAFKDIERKIKH